ncbi:hypothetical protein F4804DRAFT_339207 [Jackrogersella minutella]|nr:hypothetical protein F4804DRAFT_339207 [Jackrogersella minutella]
MEASAPRSFLDPVDRRHKAACISDFCAKTQVLNAQSDISVRLRETNEPLNGEKVEDELSKLDTDTLSSDTDSHITMQDAPSPNQQSKESTLGDEQDIETTTETMSDITEPDITTKSPYEQKELLDEEDIDEED